MPVHTLRFQKSLLGDWAGAMKSLVNEAVLLAKQEWLIDFTLVI